VLAERCLGHTFPSRLLIAFGVVSILIAASFILTQRNFRRILAYSSIDHAGIMAAALGFGGKLGALGLSLHMLFHAVTKPLMFLSVGNMQQHYRTPFFRKVRGAIKTVPWTATLLLLGTLAVTGVPPFNLFQSEFIILSAGLTAGHGLWIFLFIAGVVTVFAGFLVHMAKMNLGEPREDMPPESRECAWKLSAMILVASAMVTLAFWIPRPIHDLVDDAAEIVAAADSGKGETIPLPSETVKTVIQIPDGAHTPLKRVVNEISSQP
jgi:hydrogenase-4 component F